MSQNVLKSNLKKFQIYSIWGQFGHHYYRICHSEGVDQIAEFFRLFGLFRKKKNRAMYTQLLPLRLHKQTRNINMAAMYVCIIYYAYRKQK